MFLQIWHKLKQKYPQEDSRFLPLVAIACFLIDKGCDWLATNKENRTAAVEITYLMESTAIADIFKRECLRHHLMALARNASNDQLKQLAAGNWMDQQGRLRSIESTEGTVE